MVFCSLNLKSKAFEQYFTPTGISDLMVSLMMCEEIACGNTLTDPYPSVDFTYCDVFKTAFYFFGPALLAGSGI